MGNILTALAVVMAVVCILIHDDRLAKLDKRVKELEIFYETVKVIMAREGMQQQEEDPDGEQE